MTTPARFDEAYYRRHYAGRARVHSARDVARLAQGVTGLAAWLGVELGRVLDVGAGPGLWRDWFRRHRPAVRYRSTDVSPFACARYGHERRDLSRWRSRERHDLVICQGVLQYLDDAAAARAIDNLGAMCRGLLYLEAITAHDLAEVVDREATDLAVHARPGAWYRRRLDRWFVQVGAGLWAARRAGLALYELEGPPPGRSAI
jgi:methyltransferase family protein